MLAPTGQQCVTFDLNMYSVNPSQMGNLSVYFFQQTGYTNDREFLEELIWQSKPGLTQSNTSWHKVNIGLFNINNRNEYRVSVQVFFIVITNITSILSWTFCLYDKWQMLMYMYVYVYFFRFFLKSKEVWPCQPFPLITTLSSKELAKEEVRNMLLKYSYLRKSTGNSFQFLNYSLTRFFFLVGFWVVDVTSCYIFIYVVYGNCVSFF